MVAWSYGGPSLLGSIGRVLVQFPSYTGVQVQFLLPSTDTPWQKAEELGWKDRIAMKVDSRNPYQYAPNGLTLTKVKPHS